LDQKGLGALWNEGLGARTALRSRLSGASDGYSSHSQLERFVEHEKPLLALDAYLHHVCDEADLRGYSYNREKLCCRDLLSGFRIDSTTGQIRFEAEHLKRKLVKRKTEGRLRLPDGPLPNPREHPIFEIYLGPRERWEKGRAW
jgi:hypothetical protein